MPARGWKTLLLVAALIAAVVGVAVFYPASFATLPSALSGSGVGHARGSGTVASALSRGGLGSDGATLTALSAVLVGAGHIAYCGSSGDEATAALLDGIPGTVFTAGDNAYESGTNSEFANRYEPSWGRHKARTKPSPGNHEYATSGATGYFNYFGPAAGDPSKGYYAYDLGAWRINSLNWYEVDVSSLVTGDGSYSLKVLSTSGNGADYSSREGTNKPQLVLTVR